MFRMFRRPIININIKIECSTGAIQIVTEDMIEDAVLDAIKQFQKERIALLYK